MLVAMAPMALPDHVDGVAQRLRGSARPLRVFEAVREVIRETGVLKGKTRRALDSVVFDDAVATQDTVMQFICSRRRWR